MLNWVEHEKILLPRGLLQISVSLPSSLNNFCWYIINSGRLSLFSVLPLQSPLPHKDSVVGLLLGAGCSQELHCHHNSNSCNISNILPICWGFFFLCKTFPRLVIVVDLPCFSEIRSSQSGMLSCCFAVFILASFDLLTQNTYSVLLRRGREHLCLSWAFSPEVLSQASHLLRHCCIVGGNHGIYVHAIILQTDK